MAPVSDGEFGKRVGGRPCLDFTNTMGARLPGTPRRGHRYHDAIERERLTGYDALVRWALGAGLLAEREARALARRAAARPAEAAAVLERAIALREAIYRLVQAHIEGWATPQDDLATLDREVATARAHERLVHSPSGFGWEWDADPAALDRVLWPVARSAAELLTAPELSRVGRCPGEACGWLFLDTSRSGRRQWCDMAECGNLAKVRRFRARQRATRSP